MPGRRNDYRNDDQYRGDRRRRRGYVRPQPQPRIPFLGFFGS